MQNTQIYYCVCISDSLYQEDMISRKSRLLKYITVVCRGPARACTCKGAIIPFEDVSNKRAVTTPAVCLSLWLTAPLVGLRVCCWVWVASTPWWSGRACEGQCCKGSQLFLRTHRGSRWWWPLPGNVKICRRTKTTKTHFKVMSCIHVWQQVRIHSNWSSNPWFKSG